MICFDLAIDQKAPGIATLSQTLVILQVTLYRINLFLILNSETIRAVRVD